MRVASSGVLVVGIIAVSAASILIRNAQAEAPSLVVAAYRLSISSLVVVPMALWRHQNELHSLRAREWLLMLLAGVFLALHFAAWVTSLEYTPVTSSVVLVTTSPVWVAVASWLLLREKLTCSMIFGLIQAVVGGFVIGLGDTMQGSGSVSLLGNSLALAGALMVTGYWLIGKRVLGALSLTSYVAIVYSTASVVLLIMVGVTGQSLVGYSPSIYLWLVLLALVPQLIGHSSFNWALARLPAVSIAVATLGEPIGASLLVYFLLGDVPTLPTVLGAALVLAGIALTIRSPPSSEQAKSQ